MIKPAPARKKKLEVNLKKEMGWLKFLGTSGGMGWAALLLSGKSKPVARHRQNDYHRVFTTHFAAWYTSAQSLTA